MAYLASHRDSLAPALRDRWQSSGSLTEGTWERVFGRGAATEETFMAWHFATYVEAVAAAGKRAYPLPMFVNAALIRPGRLPGQYPSAGPLPHLIDVWRAGAPSIDFLAPDIYFPNFVERARAYARPANPFFVPETGRNPAATPANALYAFGELDAMGFSPFAIERFQGEDRLGDAYAVLQQLAPLILEHQGDEGMVGVRPPVSFEGVVDTMPQEVRLGDYTLRVGFWNPFAQGPEQGIESRGGLIIQLGPDEYLVAGCGITVTFSTSGAIAGIESIWEGNYVKGRWVRGRLLNGDESHQGRHLRIPEDEFGIQRVRLYRYRWLVRRRDPRPAAQRSTGRARCRRPSMFGFGRRRPDYGHRSTRPNERNPFIIGHFDGSGAGHGSCSLPEFGKHSRVPVPQGVTGHDWRRR